MKYSSLSTREKEKRRRKAITLKRGGWKQERIAKKLGVSEAAVSQWIRRFNSEGAKGLGARPHPGAPPRLNSEQLNDLHDSLVVAAHFGDATLLTSDQAAGIIEGEFDVIYHKAHVSRILHRLGWRYAELEIASEQERDALSFEFERDFNSKSVRRWIHKDLGRDDT
jgi:transposase